MVAPLVAMAAYDGSAWSLVVTDDYMQHRLVWTVVQAGGTCVLVLLLGIPVGWSLARLSFRGREMILRLLMLPFVMPTLVVGVGVLALFGANGVLWAGWQDTPYLCFTAMCFSTCRVGARGVSGFFAGAAGEVAVGADAGCGGLAAILFCGMAGVAPLVGGRGLFGIFVLFFGFRTGVVAGWQPLYDG